MPPLLRKPRVTLICAMSENRVISARGAIPWHLPAEIAHFRAATTDACLLMGRRTFDQMIGWFRPGHKVFVLTHSDEEPDGGEAGLVRTCRSVAEGIEAAGKLGALDVMVCGGGAVFTDALPLADVLLLTTVHATLAGDVFFPGTDGGEWCERSSLRHEADSEHAYAFTIRRLERRSDP